MTTFGSTRLCGDNRNLVANVPATLVEFSHTANCRGSLGARFTARFMGESTEIAGRARDGGVETAFGLLPVATVVPPGEAVTLVLRPENLRADGSGGISLGEARITDAVFQGAHQRVLAAGATGEQRFLLRLPPAAVTAPGTKLRLSCQAEDLIPVQA